MDQSRVGSLYHIRDHYKRYCIRQRSSQHAASNSVVTDYSITPYHHTGRTNFGTSTSRMSLPEKLFTSLVPSVQAAEVVKQTPVAEAADLQLKKPAIIVTDLDIQKYLAQESGQDRVKKMFEKNDKGTYSAEVDMVVNCSKSAAFLSFFISAIFGSRHAKEEFIRKNQHTKFPTKFRALRAHQDAIFIGGMKMGALWGLRTFVFTGMFLLTSQTIAVYRNRTTFLEYTAAGFVTGSTLRMSLGLRGWFAGGVIGGAFGTAAGLLLWGAMKLSRETQQERHYWEVQELLREKKETKLLISSATVTPEVDSPVAT